MYLDRDVLRSELREGVNTELVLKLVVRSRDQEPRRPLYMLFQGVADKRLWHDVIQNTIERFSKGVRARTDLVADKNRRYLILVGIYLKILNPYQQEKSSAQVP